MAGGTASSIFSDVGYAVETTAGTYVAPAYWLFATGGGAPTAKPAFLTKDVMSGTLASKRIKRPLKMDVQLQLQAILMANMGAPFNKLALGSDTFLTALAADTVKTALPITTTLGMSTINLTNTGAANYTLGAWVKINTNAASEFRQIVTISGNGAAGTIIAVGALKGNAAAPAGTSVIQVAQHKFTTIPTNTVRPTFSIEANQGNLYSWQLAGCLAEKYSVAFGQQDTTYTLDLYSTVKPVKLATPTTPSPSAAEAADMKYPFAIVDTQIVAPGDNTASGTSALQLMTDFETGTIEFLQNLIKKDTADLTPVRRAFPGSLDLNLSYKRVNQDKRNTEWEDYISNLANTTTPVFMGAAINTGGSGTDAWQSWGAYVPTAVYMSSDPVLANGDVIGVNVVMGPIVTSATADLAQIFVTNSAGTAY